MIDTKLKKVAEFLWKNNLTIATAESCTGGLLASRFTDIAGSSSYINESHVTYANSAKHKYLNVDNEIFEKYGAVSYECAHAMAEGLKKLSNCDIAVCTTGIAGPGGGTPEKPVGLVYISISTKDIHCFCRLNLDGDRFEVRRKTCLYVLELVKRMAV